MTISNKQRGKLRTAVRARLLLEGPAYAKALEFDEDYLRLTFPDGSSATLYFQDDEPAGIDNPIDYSLALCEGRDDGQSRLQWRDLDVVADLGRLIRRALAEDRICMGCGRPTA